jgi:hypothetical protein
MTEKLLREIWEDDLTPKKKILNRNLAENDLFDAEEDDGLDYCVDGELWNPNNRAK